AERDVVILREERRRPEVDEPEAVAAGATVRRVRARRAIVRRELRHQPAGVDVLVDVRIDLEGVAERTLVNGRAVVALGRVLDPDLPVGRYLVGPLVHVAVAREVEM